MEKYDLTCELLKNGIRSEELNEVINDFDIIEEKKINEIINETLKDLWTKTLVAYLTSL